MTISMDFFDWDDVWETSSISIRGYANALETSDEEALSLIVHQWSEYRLKDDLNKINEGTRMTEIFEPRTYTMSKFARETITSTSVKRNIGTAEALDRIIKEWAANEAIKNGEAKDDDSPLNALAEKIEKIEEEVDKLLEKLEVARL